MEILGNIEHMQESIRQKYEKDIINVQEELEKTIAAKKQESKKQAEITKFHLCATTDFEVKKEHSKILNEENLKAKRDFESAREELIESVFKEVEKKAIKIAHSKAYIGLVKKRMPKNCTIIADSDFFKKYFDNIKIDKSIVGIKCKVGDIIYNFSLDGIIKYKKHELRDIITGVLFE